MCGKKIPAWLWFAMLCVLPLTACGGGAAPTSPSAEILSFSGSLPQANYLQSYNAGLQVSGGNPPYSWSISSGQLPPGLTIANGTGMITGTPTQMGRFSFALGVKDSGNGTGSQAEILNVTTPLDQYGGLLALPSSNPSTGYFRLERVGNRWRLVTPDNNVFWMFSVYSVGTMDGGSTYTNAAISKYGDNSTVFSRQAVRRLRLWGFNTVGEYHNSYVTPAPLQAANHANSEKMPFLHLINTVLEPVADGALKNIVIGTDPGSCCYTGYRGGSLGDVFDPAWSSGVDNVISTWMSNWAGQNPATFPWLISITTDDGDGIFGFRRLSNPNAAWLIAATTPRQAVSSNGTEFSDTTVYSKLAWRDFLKSKYGSDISVLNAAWGSNYSSWDSTTHPWQQGVPGNGTGNQTFYLPHIPVSPGTVTLSVAGTSISGQDDGLGNITGTDVATGSSINYGSGKITLNTTVAITGLVTANYTGDGWPKNQSGGSGLLDEDGSSAWLHPSGSPADYAGLSGLPTAVHNDLNDFLASPNVGDTNRLANHYFAKVSSAVKTNFPNVLVAPPAPLNADLVARPDGSGITILQAAAAYYDWIQISITVPDLPIRGSTTNYIKSTYDVTKKPIYVALIVTAQSDSPLAAFPRRTSQDSSTQALRGQMYQDSLRAAFNTQGSDGISPVVGLDFWEWTDKTTGGENGNFGLVTNLDNAYDGLEDLIRSGVDQWGYATGGENSDYGDFLTTVTNTNLGIMQSLITH